MDFRPERLLGDAIEAARRALRELDPDQVPASLQRVAGHTGGALPPPFARSLLAELDSNEFLRSKTLEAWQGENPPSDERLLPSYRFLERDDGWFIEVAAAAFGLGARTVAAGDRKLEIERDALKAEIVSLKERLKALHKDYERVEGDLRESLRAGREPLRAERTTERRLVEQLEEARSAHVARVEELESRLSGVQSELESAREAARRDRGLRAEAESAHRVAVTSDPPSMDPDALAERLDVIAALAAAAGPRPDADDEIAAGRGGEQLEYPGAIRPDSAEAIDWLLSAGDATVLIDGYNLGFLLAGGRLDASRARMLVVEVVGRLGAVARHARFVAVFDSEIEADATALQRGGSVEVVYSSGRSADDEIADRAATVLHPVVITNDRDLRHRAEGVGAVALWSDALAEWSRRR